jgi:hypothetical protein
MEMWRNLTICLLYQAKVPSYILKILIWVLFRTTNGQLRATIGLWDSFNKDAALEIANYGERLLLRGAVYR